MQQSKQNFKSDQITGAWSLVRAFDS